MVGVPYIPEAGHIIKVDLDPSMGHEQAGWRPALVLSHKLYNAKTGLAVVVPVTNRAKGYSFEVPLPKQMKTSGVVLADAVKNLDWKIRGAKFSEIAPRDVLEAVQERLMLLLGFPTP